MCDIHYHTKIRWTRSKYTTIPCTATGEGYENGSNQLLPKHGEIQPFTPEGMVLHETGEPKKCEREITQPWS